MSAALSLAGRRALVGAGGELGAALVGLLRGVGAEPVDLPRQGGLAAAMASRWSPVDAGAAAVLLDAERRAGPAEEAAAAFELVELLQWCERSGGGAPAHVVVLRAEASAAEGPALRLWTTLVRYVSAHLRAAPVRVNLVVYSPGPEGSLRGAEAALALCSGWLDAVKGQRLDVRCAP